jgi:hypothetical protein
VPTSLAQETGLALGAQAGPRRISEVIRAGGFEHVRKAAQTPPQHGDRGQVTRGRAAGSRLMGR